MSSKLTIAAVILMTVLLTSCNVGIGEAIGGADYSEYTVLDKTEDQYINSIKNIINIAYAPKPGVSKADIERSLSKYMTADCVEKFVKENDKSGVSASNVKCEVKQIYFAYGQHQLDGIAKIIAPIRVETEKHYWEFTIEMKINSDDLIYNIDVY